MMWNAVVRSTLTHGLTVKMTRGELRSLHTDALDPSTMAGGNIAKITHT